MQGSLRERQKSVWSRTTVGLCASAALMMNSAHTPDLCLAADAVPKIAAKSSETAAKSSDTPAKTSETSVKKSSNSMTAVLDAAQASKQQALKISDYSAVFIKRERFRDQLLQTSMDIKVRHEPFSVYVKYHDPHAGREVIYVDGKHKGKLLVHEEGFASLAGTLSFAPDSNEAMNENHYPITKLGLRTMLDTVIAQWEQDAKVPGIEIKFYPDAKIGDVLCNLLETVHPQPTSQVKIHKTRLYIDKANGLPIRVEQYGFAKKAGENPPLIEEYTYTQLKLNPGLADKDFDTKNKAYRF